jgi:hypothetical protein
MIWRLGLDPSREGVRAHGDRRIWIQRCGAKGYAASNQARRSQIEWPGSTPHARAAVLTRRRPISRRHGSGLTGVRQDRCSGGFWVSGLCRGERVDDGEPVWATSAADWGQIVSRHGERWRWDAGVVFRPPEGATRHYITRKRERGVVYCSPRARDKRRRGAEATPAGTGGEVGRCLRMGRRGDAPDVWIPRSGSGSICEAGRGVREA